MNDGLGPAVGVLIAAFIIYLLLYIGENKLIR